MASSSRSSRPRAAEINCPLCSYTADDEAIIQLHFEHVHDNPTPPPLPPKPPKPSKKERITLSPIFKIPSAAPEDPYDPFKYQIPNNNSQEVVGAPVYRNSRPETSAPTSHPAPRVSTVAEPETEYVTCEWPGCGEPVGLVELEEHLAMHESELEAIVDEDDDYSFESMPMSDSVVVQRERKGDALMDAASKKRHIPKKEGPSNRQPKKMGQMERRLESEALAQEVDLVIRLDEEDDVVKVQRPTEHPRSGTQTDDESREYEFISKDEITEDDYDKAEESLREEEESSPRFGSRHGKKLHKPSPGSGYGGYEIKKSKHHNPKRRPDGSSNSSLNGGSTVGSTVGSVKSKFKKSELGPYANERRMPEWLKEALKAGGKEVFSRHIGSDGLVHVRKTYENETTGLIPVIRQLCALDPSVRKAYLCHPCVKHVYKEHPAANGFCGYRNIQMMASYCRKNLIPGCERLFEERIPTVIQIQKWIEHAWDQGINAHAREETGGILYTRKYIGSSEVEAMFTYFGTATTPRQFSEPNQQINALRHVWNYFSSGIDVPDKAVQTDRPPIYFQHHGHSMTIIGIEQYRDGTFCFLCFDPMFSPSQNIRKLIGDKRIRPNIAYGKLLKAFRRGGPYLKRYSIFEMVELAPTFEPDSTLYE